MATYGVRLYIMGVKSPWLSGVTKEEAKAKADEFNASMKEKGAAEDYKAKVFIEMNAHEKQIDYLIRNAVSEFIGGWENTMADNPEGSEEYESAKAMLNHDTLFGLIYDDVMYYSNKNYASHLRFAGKAFIEERIESRLKKEGYGK